MSDNILDDLGNLGGDNQELTDADKRLIAQKCAENPDNPPGVTELCELIRPGKELDGRSQIGRAVMKYVVSVLGVKPSTKTEYKKRNESISS